MNIAIIPARGGSKRIPRKNIKDFCGQPMLAYPIKAALSSGVIDRVIVSTDDAEIATIAKHYGAEVPFYRPAELSDDYTGTTEVIQDTLRKLQKIGVQPQYCCCIYATTPLLHPEFLQQALTTLINAHNTNFVFSVTRFSFPIQRALVQTATGGVMPFDPLSISKRSQDLVPAYHDAGQFYWGKTNAWLDPKVSVFSEHSKMQVLPDHLVQDIDTTEDWQRAEVLYQLLQQRKSQ